MQGLVQSFNAIQLSSRQNKQIASPSRSAHSKQRVSVIVEAKKKWEKQAVNQNGNPVRVKMHVKTNDKVIVVAGADKGKITEVVEVFTKNGQILCKDVNIKTKHVKPRNEQKHTTR
jgi:acid phosphatase class B